MWLFGGGSNANWANYSDLWKYDISTNLWTWMKGPNIPNQPPVYGTKGIPDPVNNPSPRWCYSKWKDLNGNFWLFGGADFSNGNYWNNMWEFNPVLNEWTWVNGPNFANSGYIGTECISAPNYVPSNRLESRACWTRSCDNFVVFGGIGHNNGAYNDMWNYSVANNEWTWMSGSVLSNGTGNYGVILVSNPANMPISRLGSIGWSDSSGNLWMFGGQDSGKYYNDIWRFVPDSTCPSIKGTTIVTSSDRKSTRLNSSH